MVNRPMDAGDLGLRRLSPVCGGARVLALHSLGLTGDSFAALAAALGSQAEVWVIDQRGHGIQRDRRARGFDTLVTDALSSVDLLAGDGPVHLLGHSLGGAVAATAAARRPDCIASLSVIATPPRGMEIFRDRAAACDLGLGHCIETTMSRWFDPVAMASAQAAHARRALSQMTPEGFDAAWHALADFPGYGPIASALPEVLALAYCLDQSTPPVALDEIAEAITTAKGRVRRVDLGGAGHMGVLEQPDATAAAILALLVSTEAKTKAPATGVQTTKEGRQ